MINETHPTELTHTPLFGTRLQTAREALNMDRKQAAAKLRLNEKFITAMEENNYPDDLHITFIRGYIRAYGKLLEIPEHDIKQALEPLQPKTVEMPIESALKLPRSNETTNNHFIKFFTYLVVATLIGLIGLSWFKSNLPAAATATTPLAVIKPPMQQTTPLVQQAYNNSSDTDNDKSSDDNSDDNSDNNSNDNNNDN